MNLNLINHLSHIALNNLNNVHKHSAVAIKGHSIISPFFHNYDRTYMFGKIVGSFHAEMAVVNFLINSFFSKKQKHCLL